jgi:hypothetical protein
MDDATSTTETSVQNNILVPTDTDKEPIIWTGNDAHIEGTLLDVGRYYERVGLFQPLFENRAVLLSNGKLAVETVQAVPFVNGTFSDPRSFDDPCPPTVERVAEHRTRTLAASLAYVAPPATLTPDAASQYSVSKYAVAQEDSRLLHSLSFVFSGTDVSEDLLNSAQGSGLKFIAGTAQTRSTPRAKERDPRDRSRRKRLVAQPNGPRRAIF